MSDKTCCYCNQPLNTLPDTKGNPLRLTRDHIVPKSRGGSDNPCNILFACVSCNSEKSDMTLDEYLWWIENNPFNVTLKEEKIKNIKNIIEEIKGNPHIYVHSLTPKHRIGYSKEKPGKTIVLPGSYADNIIGVKVLGKVALPVDRKRSVKR